MRNFIKKMMMTVVMALAMLFGFTSPAVAQKAGKISGATRLVLRDRDGKMSLETPQGLTRDKKTTFNTDGSITTQEAFGGGQELPFAKPTMVDGLKMVQCWIDMTDQDYSRLESLGVKIQAKFDGKVTANVPVVAIEQVASLSNVAKVSVAKRLKEKTYRSRVLTNVDDVLTLSADAQAAGLSQAYNGTGVVLGIIDTGIDFGHQMFSGRIKKKYVYNTTSEQLEEYTGSSAYFTEETHGTHTSSIAGGSDYTATAYVYTTGTSYTTVNNAKFGGMAPGTDLVLCDLGEELTDANISACIKLISDYADQVGKPSVTSLSLGGHFGPHDGTGDMADVCAQYTGPGKIILFAAGNEGEDNIYLGKNASSSSPAMTVLSSQTRSSYSVDYGAMISYARTPNTELAARYYVVNTSTNTVLWTSNEITTDDKFIDNEGNIELYGAEISVNDTGADGTTKLSNYFTAYNNNSDSYGFICCYMDKDSHNDKWNIETILYYLKPVSNNYKIGVSIYPKTGTSYVDSWPVAYLDFTASSATVNGNRFTAGSNESSASDEASYPSVISVGAYVSSKYWRAGTTSASNQAWSNNGTYQQIAMFSSYQSEGSGPTGLKQPWITAPGEVILAAYNSGYTAESNYYYAYGTNKVLGAMSGTSMATPCAAGITALWLQVNPTLTPAQVKEIMAETAIKDSYVTGTYASHFGNGKIDALAGVKYLLEHAGPTISATPKTVSFEGYATQTYTKTVTVKGMSLEGNITATLSDANGIYSIDKTSITQTDGSAQADITITWAPTAAGTTNATITLSSAGADDVVVNITGVAEAATPTILADPTSLEFSTGLSEGQSKTVTVTGRFLTGNVTATLSDANGVFSVSPATLTAANVMGDNGVTLTITFNSASEGNFTGTVTLASAGAQSVTINLSAEAQDGGTASDAYLNIAKYKTIDEAGWNTGYVNNLYKYTEYESAECAWLTLPVYGAWSACYYNSHPQKWIKTNVTNTNNKYAGTTWNSNPELLGSSSYFTKTTARGMGYNSRTNYTQETVTFYVTNTTAVKLLGLGQSRANSTYPATLKIYECTLNANGTLVEGSTTVKSYSNSATSGTFVLSATDLDASKIYKVEAATYRSYICEIGFKTPLKKGTITADPTSLSFETFVGEPVTKTFHVTGTGLKNKPITVTVTNGSNVYTVDKNSITATEAENGGVDVTVTFTPTAEGENITGTVTLHSDGAKNDATVALNGKAHKRTLIADPTELTFKTLKGTTQSKTFDVRGEHLKGAVTLTLADANGVFSIDKNSLTKAEAEEGQTITVTFAPTANGDYTGTVTLSSDGVENVVVELNATSYPDGYDVTISKYGLTTLYVDFPLEIPYDTYDPDLLGVYYVKEATGTEVKLADVGDYIPANTGVIIQGNSGTYTFPRYRGTVDPIPANLLRGSLTNITPAKALQEANASSTSIVMTLGLGGNGYVGFYKYTGKTLNANRAYLIYDKGAQSNLNMLSIGGMGGEFTGINDVDARFDEGAWYTLQGVRLNGKPLQRGVYLHNGKAVVVR